MAAEWHPKQELDALGGGRAKPPKRAARVADMIRNELSVLLLQRIRDPHLRDASISRVELSDDLRHAKIYYTSLGGRKDMGQMQKSFAKAAGFMRSHLARTLNMRFTPELRFWYDDDVEKVEQIEKVLADIARERRDRESGT